MIHFLQGTNHTHDFPSTLGLDVLLEGSGLHLRGTILGALIREGFEMEDAFPCLHHPREILEALDTQKYGLGGGPWDSILRTLETAQRIGVLVDVRIGGGASRPLPCPEVDDFDFEPVPA